MRTFVEQKSKILEILDHTKQIIETHDFNEERQKAKKLGQDMYTDFYTIVTVGEFNNGKSTFVNALLGEDLLPTGVIPTTATINAVSWGEQRALRIFKQDDTVEEMDLNEMVLHKYVTSKECDMDEIHYLGISLPSPLLKNHVVLIDTPGVNDLNTLRSNITYQFIPRADVVLFVLNITTPLRKSEYDFLAETLLKQGLDRIIFIANFMDQVDADEISDVIEGIEVKLKKIPEFKEVEVYPLSALEALEGKMGSNDELLKYSGMLPIEERITRMIQSGTRAKEKLNRFSTRMEYLLHELLNNLIQKQALFSKTELELKEELAASLVMIEAQKEIEQELHVYIHERNEEISFMVNKSIEYLFTRIHDDIEEQIDMYSGSDITTFIKKQVPNYMRRSLKNWIEEYSKHIHELLLKLELEISKGLSESFNATIRINTGNDENIKYKTNVRLITPDTTDPTVSSGLILGGAGTLAIVLGGPIFLPIIGMAGLPFLSKALLKNQLEDVKPKLQSEARKQMAKVREQFTQAVLGYLQESIVKIEEETFTQFQSQAHKYRQTVENEMKNKQKNIDTNEMDQKRVESSIEELNALIERVKREGRDLR
jgi:GTPase SAR1 family protein